jgi:hypothetical protein
MVTYSGTIFSGVDSQGHFGTAGAGLTGKNYTANLTFDDANGFPAYGEAVGFSGDVAGGFLTGVEITIGGVSYSPPLSDFNSASYGAGVVLQQLPGGSLETIVFTGLSATGPAINVDLAGSFFDTQYSSLSLSPFSITFPSGQCGVSYIGCDADFDFGGNDLGNDQLVAGDITSISISDDVVPIFDAYVPEPAIWGLMLAGLFATGFTVRRRAPFQLARQATP